MLIDAWGYRDITYQIKLDESYNAGYLKGIEEAEIRKKDEIISEKDRIIKEKDAELKELKEKLQKIKEEIKELGDEETL